VNTVDAANPNVPGTGSDAATLASSLAQLTSGWTAAPGVARQSLTVARQAIAASLLAGKSIADLYAAPARVRATPQANPKLAGELLHLANTAIAQPAQRTVAVIRSSSAATQSNPLGRPEWVRGAQILQSYGPFQDSQGVVHWVDLILLTRSIPFAFGSAASPFGVFPYHGTLIPPPSPSTLSLGGGSIWFLANLLSSALPAGNFTGFTISGGTLKSSVPLSYQNGVYVAPTGATLTITATLAPLSQPVPTGDPGADAAAAMFVPPSSVTIFIRENAVTFEAVADSSARAYGTTVTLHWNHKTPVQSAGQPLVIIPCDVSPGIFAFNDVQSELMIPSGRAAITAGGWALPLSATTISTLPEAAGPGAAGIALGSGASLVNALEPEPVAVAAGSIEVGTGALYLVLIGKAASVQTTYQLWPQAAPSKLNSIVKFSTLTDFGFAFLATPSQELLYAPGSVTAFLDRPLDAAAARFPYQSSCVLLIDAGKTVTHLYIGGGNSVPASTIRSLALENALIGVELPSALLLYGTLQGLDVVKCSVGLFFTSRWLLPTLPDPYAANFDLSFIPREAESGFQAILLAIIAWTGGSAAPALSFELLPSPAGAGTAGTPFPSNLPATNDAVAVARGGTGAAPALLDLSTRVDLFGVAVFPALAELLLLTERSQNVDNFTGASTPAPPLALSGMSLALNGALAVTFALPQVSWEPMESTASDEPGPIYCEPPADGPPLLVSAPDNQQLVPFSPGPLLLNNIENVAAGHPFAAIFSLPFGLDAVIIQPNRAVKERGGVGSSFKSAGGKFGLNRPIFPESFVPNPTSPIAKVEGAVQLSVVSEHPDRLDASFPGFTEVDAAHGPYIGPAPNGYGYTVLGPENTSGVGLMFENQFGASSKTRSVPLNRIDFSGYGASIFSEWIKNDAVPPAIIKVQFDASIGRTAYEVVKAFSVIYPYYVKAVRTVTMLRQNAGWVKRTDTGWQPASQGQFQFPGAAWTNRIHLGSLAGVFNVRNIREQAETVTVPNPGSPTQPFLFKKVMFDADLGVASGLKVVNGGFEAPVAGISDPPVLVSSTNMVGYLQIQPDSTVPDPSIMENLLGQVGPLSPAISCTVEVGATSNLPGTTLRCTAFQTNIISQGTAGPVPALGVALMGAPQIPRGGGWNMGQRKFSDPAPSALPSDLPVPLVQPTASPPVKTWYMADVTDILRLDLPANYYSLMHSTGTNKVLFEAPQIPANAATPGLQFPKPTGAPMPGGVPLNKGSPNLGDLASILNSTGLFPDIGNAISVMQQAIEQINTIGQGLKYTKSYPGSTDPPLPTTTLIDLGIISINLAYADTTQTPSQPGALTYTVDSSASPSWSLKIGPLSFEVIVSTFGSDAVITITGEFYADEHTKAGLTGLNIHMGSALGAIQSVFSKIQALAQFLPGGVGANLDVAIANGTISVTDSFTIGDLPLGLGDLTDISLDLGLNVQLSPLSVDFSVGIGDPDNPFNWIVSPLAGNGLMDFGVSANQPSFTIQAGIGLGLAIDLGIASGSASITIAVQLNIDGNSITVMAILSGQASVDVLDGLASASLSLSAALGFGLSPLVPPITFTPPPPSLPTSVTLGPETVTLLASCSVGIHLSVCWVVSVSWDGSWSFSQSITSPQITVGV
jgi:hypothetical protein